MLFKCFNSIYFVQPNMNLRAIGISFYPVNNYQEFMFFSSPIFNPEQS